MALSNFNFDFWSFLIIFIILRSILSVALVRILCYVGFMIRGLIFFILVCGFAIIKSYGTLFLSYNTLCTGGERLLLEFWWAHSVLCFSSRIRLLINVTIVLNTIWQRLFSTTNIGYCFSGSSIGCCFVEIFLLWFFLIGEILNFWFTPLNLAANPSINTNRSTTITIVFFLKTFFPRNHFRFLKHTVNFPSDSLDTTNRLIITALFWSIPALKFIQFFL